jgi:hypothetical protein
MPGTAETHLVTKLEEGTLMSVFSCCTYRWVQWRWRWLWWWCHLSAARRFGRLENDPHNLLGFKLPVPQRKDLEIKFNTEHRKFLHYQKISPISSALNGWAHKYLLKNSFLVSNLDAHLQLYKTGSVLFPRKSTMGRSRLYIAGTLLSSVSVL